MTIRELYQWAVDNGALDLTVVTSEIIEHSGYVDEFLTEADPHFRERGERPNDIPDEAAPGKFHSNWTDRIIVL